MHADSVTVTTTNGEEVVVETPKGDSWSVNIKPATDPTPQVRHEACSACIMDALDSTWILQWPADS